MKILDSIQRRFRGVLRGLFPRTEKPVALRYAMPGRTIMPDTEAYYLGVMIGGAVHRIKGKARSFWDLCDFKRAMNVGRKYQKYFVVDRGGRVVSTIDSKLMTVCSVCR